MKKANSILSHILHLPQFKTLKSHYCYQKFISLLNPRFQKAIAFVYVRQDTLFVALSHPGFKMELNYNKDLLKNLLTMLAKHDEKCKSLKVSKVVLFNSKHNSIIREKKIEDTVPHYEEMAWGEFTIESEDKELREAFEKIRESIEQQI
ncbi:hypothetical protein GSY74_01360 [Sulfurovum sp. bin170]|uniref:hypothetical protein n=1 Tax=Sulfurovum sp. bin170 TaxID=2695268 RepID=UPI0013DFAE0C|nr:hypothetical protein [Sulfurovum sp. bin170]NEW59917.1 hypothetical protein [Sulfurovum sp. bin170]